MENSAEQNESTNAGAIPMNSFDDPISKDNVRREFEHNGEECVCGKCGRTGVVGDTLVGAFTISSLGEGWPWWVHKACAYEAMKETAQ